LRNTFFIKGGGKSKKVKKRAKPYEVSVDSTSKGYYEAKISFKIGGGRSPRYRKGAKTFEKSVLGLLKELSGNIDSLFKNKCITMKIDDIVQERLIESINNLKLMSVPKIAEKVLLIVNKINSINSNISDKMVLQTNGVQKHNENDTVTNNGNFKISNEIKSYEQKNKENSCKLEEILIDWLEYKFSLCIKTDENPNPLSRKTIDDYHKTLMNKILPYFKNKKKVYLNEIDKEVIKELIKSNNGYQSKRNIYIVLSMLFDYARKKRKMTHDPLKDIDKPVKPEKREEEKTPFIEPERQNIWLDKFEEDMTDKSILFETMLLTGIRPEEACRIKVECH